MQTGCKDYQQMPKVVMIRYRVSLTADPGVVSSMPAWSHNFVEIDHEIIPTVILLRLIQEGQDFS